MTSLNLLLFTITDEAWHWIWAVVIVSCILVGIIIAALLITSKRHGSKRVIEYSELQQAQNIEDGYIGVDMSPATCVGKCGVAITDMRPSGKISINDKDYDAVALLGFLDAGTDIEVVKYENTQLYVKAKKQQL